MSYGILVPTFAPDTCRLCLAKKPLQQSHILPEFFWKDVYEKLPNGGRRVPKTVYEANAVPELTHYQRGLREELLCWDCEQKLGRWESYTKRMLLDKLPSIPRSIFSVRLELRTLLLFQLSMLWRCGLTKYAGLALPVPPEVMEIFRCCLLNEAPLSCPIEYERVPVYVEGAGVPIKFATNGIIVELEPDSGSSVYRILAGGIVWSYHVRNKPHVYSIGMTRVRFRPCHVFDFDFLWSIAKTWFNTGAQ